MNSNNDSLAFLAIPIALIGVGVLLVKAVTSFFNYLGFLMTAIAMAFAGFAKLLISVGLIVVAALIVGGILYAGFYCIIRYIRTVKKITAFREEFIDREFNLRSHVQGEVESLNQKNQLLISELNQKMTELRAMAKALTPKTVEAPKAQSIPIASAQNNEPLDTSKLTEEQFTKNDDEVLISHQY